MSDNNTQIYEDEMDFASPNHMRRTLRRLWVSVNDQHKRLIVVLVSVVFYTLLSVAAPFYSAHIVDLLWNSIKEAMAGGEAFRVTWHHGGRDIFILLLIYLATAFFICCNPFSWPVLLRTSACV